MKKSIRTTEQILADLEAQFPKTTVEEGKQTMARNTKAAKPQQDLKDARSTLQMNQNKKLSAKDFGAVMTKAFGEKHGTTLVRKFRELTIPLRGKVPVEHFTYDFRGGWGKAANVRVFIPQDWNGVGVWIRVSLDVVGGIWNADSAKVYDKPQPYQGTDLTEFKRESTTTRKIKQSSISGTTVLGAGVLGSINIVETERAGVLYTNAQVNVGIIKKGDTVTIYDATDKVLGTAEIVNMYLLNDETIESVKVIEEAVAGALIAVQFDEPNNIPLCNGFRIYVTKSALPKVATTEEAMAPKVGDDGIPERADFGARLRGVRKAAENLMGGSLHAHDKMPYADLGFAVVTDVFNSPTGPVQAVNVVKGSVCVGDGVQVWRSGRYHVAGVIEHIRQYKDTVNEVGALGENTECGLNIALDGITDLKREDKIYVVKRPGVADFSDVSISYTEDARGKTASIDYEGHTLAQMNEMASEVIPRLGVPVNEALAVLGAVQAVLGMVKDAAGDQKPRALTIELLKPTEFYPVAARVFAQYGPNNGDAAVGTAVILDGIPRPLVQISAGELVLGVITHAKPMHGLYMYFHLREFTRALDERDQADFESLYLEKYRLGLADEVFIQSGDKGTADLIVQKSKYHASGYAVLSMEITREGGDARYHFHEVAEPLSGPKSPTEITVEVSGRDRFVLSGPIDANYVEVVRKQIGEHNEEKVFVYPTSLAEVKRVATEALVDNPDHWKDDQIVPWKAVMRFAQGPNDCYGKVAIVNMSGNGGSGFAIDFKFANGAVVTSLVYGFGRYANLVMLQGVVQDRILGARVIAEHLINNELGDVHNLVRAIAGRGMDEEGKIILAQKPERNAMVVILQGDTADQDHVVVELNLVNGRIVSWNVPKARVTPTKQPVQPQRHHRMDPEHNATSIVPRPKAECSVSNLIGYQAQTILRALITEEGDQPKYEMLNDFIERCYREASVGGTGNALLIGVQLFDGRLSVEVKYIDVDGSHKLVADMAVYL